tara:strand:- start:151 stop:507 length:357 start_codon:yes stop_codon:yes gene_type:complete
MSEYERRYETHLKENRPKMYASLKQAGTLREHVRSVAKQADEMAASLMHRYLTEKLEKMPDKWQTMADLKKQARVSNEARLYADEIVMQDLILIPPEADEDDSQVIGPTGAYEDRITA